MLIADPIRHAILKLSTRRARHSLFDGSARPTRPRSEGNVMVRFIATIRAGISYAFRPKRGSDSGFDETSQSTPRLGRRNLLRAALVATGVQIALKRSAGAVGCCPGAASNVYTCTQCLYWAVSHSAVWWDCTCYACASGPICYNNCRNPRGNC